MKNSTLFSEIKINGMTLKNRIYMCPMVTNHAARNGEVTEELIRYHAARARGGCAINMMEATYVSREGDSYFRGVGLDNDDLLHGLKKLTDAVHAEGGKIGAQLQHGGRTGKPHFSGKTALIVSSIPQLTIYEECRVMDEEDIQHIVTSYHDAAIRAKKAGFDAVEVHAAHGYLLCQFLSSYTNHRQDEYGGSLENRMRLPLKVMDTVREAVGKDFPVFVRLSVEEFVQDGVTLEESKIIAKKFVEHGADALSISVGTTESAYFITPPSRTPEGWNAERAFAIKNAIESKVPVIVAGRIATAQTAEEILQTGKADLVGMGRALIADPELPNKAKSDQLDSIMHCVNCNEGCVGAMVRNESLTCAINPLAGFEGKYPLFPAKVSKKVLVIGAGPAGMYAAWIAKQRGHTVTLVEQKDHVGGLLNIAKLPPHKQGYGDVVRVLEQNARNVGVKIILNKTVDADFLQKEQPDVILAATGSKEIIPSFCKDVPLITAAEVLQKIPSGDSFLILGGGLVGCETAEFLAEHGKKVRIIEMKDKAAADMDSRCRHLLLKTLSEYGVKISVNTKIENIDRNNNVTVINPFGVQQILTGFDTLVAAFGYSPNCSFATALSDIDIPVILIGDCKKTANVRTAMKDALEAAYSL